MNGVYYNAKENIIVFTQSGDEDDDYYDNPDWQLIYGTEES